MQVKVARTQETTGPIGKSLGREGGQEQFQKNEQISRNPDSLYLTVHPGFRH
jgi:hypothetical protein